MPKPWTIPVLLLKTRSSSHDSYEEYFASSSSSTTTTPSSVGDGGSLWIFQPKFIPVLEHRPNTTNLRGLSELLKSGNLPEKYGGMIFTSQRAVEAWAEVVERVRVEVEREGNATQRTTATTAAPAAGTGLSGSSHQGTSTVRPASGEEPVEDDSTFPIYTVGPATSRALRTLVESEQNSSPPSPFARLRPAVLGEHTGNGGSLAEYILSHYNQRDTTRRRSTLSGEDEDDDNQKRKRGLLFLVGEQRRDIIPKTLMDLDGKLEDPRHRIHVDEVEVYKTETMESFQHNFGAQMESSKNQDVPPVVVVVVVFSPQGCQAMLRSLGFIDDTNTLTDRARCRWEEEEEEQEKSVGSSSGGNDKERRRQPKPVIVTIGPTTRDHLKKKYGFDADVCAEKPSPQGVGDGLLAFLQSKGITRL